jgi:uncharacterized protein (DUF1697 family)
MKKEITPHKYLALLRGINVGGHHKVPMADLQKQLAKLGFTDIVTLLNSGNVVFDAPETSIDALEIKITAHLEKSFGFPVPVLLRRAEEILSISHLDPFRNIEVTKDTRLYVSFLKKAPTIKIGLPWTSDDKSFRILDIGDRAIFSVLDVSVSGTPDGMEALERLFGKEITTRNLNTITRIVSKL